MNRHFQPIVTPKSLSKLHLAPSRHQILLPQHFIRALNTLHCGLCGGLDVGG